MTDVPRHFRISERAMRDAARLDLDVLEALIHVIVFGLSVPPDEGDPDEGTIGKIYYYRRGLTKQQRQDLDKDASEGRDRDIGGAGRHPWQFVIVYRKFTASECIRYRHTFKAVVVERFVGEPELGQALLAGYDFP
ncbi:hypothetical protein ACWGIV_11275 [Streptomyces sp. NPDC054844]